MNRPRAPSERVAQEIRQVFDTNGKARHRVTGDAVRSAAQRAIKGTRLVGRGAGNLAREAVEGAVKAVGEVGGEAGAFVKDAVVGVVEGTGQVVTVTTPAVREVVVGAIRGSRETSAEIGEIGRDAVEGAIVGAASVGIDSAEAASAAVEGAIEAVVEAGGNLRDVATATVGGVVSGVTAIDGDVAAATRQAAYSLVAHDAVAEQNLTEVADVAEGAVDAALQEVAGVDEQAQEVVVAAATGVVEAAYQVSRSHGDNVRRSVVRKVLEHRVALSPDLEQRLSDISVRLSNELPRGRAAWRGVALVRAARLLLHAGGIDLAASLAFFTILSFLPLIALAIMTVGFFGGPETVGEELTAVLVYYFPASEELIREAVHNLLSGSLAFGIVALVGMVVGANGLFMAANRSVNRVFGIEARGALQVTVTEAAAAVLLAILFLLSLGHTALLQIVVNFGAGIVESTGWLSTATLVVLGVSSTLIPVLLTAAVFSVVYHRLPNARVEWRDSTFGALIAIVLFEAGKHLFFWFTVFSSQRNAVYGPAASVIVLMMWGYIASLIFLYGASLAKVAGDLRPTPMVGGGGVEPPASCV